MKRRVNPSPRASSATAALRKRDRRMQEVLKAASDVFAEKGFFGATTRDIAERLEMLPGSLYYYISSKEDALLKVCEQTGRRYVRMMQELLRDPAPVTELVARGILSHIQGNRIDLVYSFALGTRELPPALRNNLSKLSRRYQKQWEQLLERGVQSGEFRAGLDCRLAAVGVLALCNGAVGWYEKRPAREIESIARSFSSLLLSGMTRHAGRDRLR